MSLVVHLLLPLAAETYLVLAVAVFAVSLGGYLEPERGALSLLDGAGWPVWAFRHKTKLIGLLRS